MKIYRVFEVEHNGNLSIAIHEAIVTRETPNRYYVEGNLRISDYKETINKNRRWIADSKQKALRYFVRSKMQELRNLETREKHIWTIIEIASGEIRSGMENENES